MSLRDIQTAVTFLSTRVKSPYEENWGNIKRVLKYLKGDKYMKLTFSSGTLSIIKWWVDASDRKHMDCKGCNGAMMSLVKCYVSSYSRKQKLNNKISTES